MGMKPFDSNGKEQHECYPSDAYGKEIKEEGWGNGPGRMMSEKALKKKARAHEKAVAAKPADAST